MSEETTKECEACGATIGKTDANCPACGEDLETLGEAVTLVEKANKVLEKRKAKTAPPTPVPQPVPEKKVSVFGRLALKRRK